MKVKVRVGLAVLLLTLAVMIVIAIAAPKSMTSNGQMKEPATGSNQSAISEAGAGASAESAEAVYAEGSGPLNASGAVQAAAAPGALSDDAALSPDAAPSADGLRAAFIRSGSLWMRSGTEERQLTGAPEKGSRIRYPRWSADGRWIAYSKEKRQDYVKELHIIEVKSGNDRIAGTADGYYEWSPTDSRLAYIRDGELSWIEVKEPIKPIIAAQEISNFSWLPDGSGFFASTQAKPIGTGGDLMNWTQVKLLRIPLSAAGDPTRFETVFTLPKPSDQLFAVGTSPFRWSADGQWIAFLATPTASLSADGNALCIVASDGRTFRQVDEMVNNPDWFEWAPTGETLAYIGGGGRMATSNKQLRTVANPSAEPVSYTPQGKVDQGFTWDGPNRIIVSRAAASEWENEPAKRPYPALFAIDLPTGEVSPLTDGAKAASSANSAAYGEYDPAILSRERLAWVRSDRASADAMLAGPDGGLAGVWIRGLELGDNYYEQWRWDAVLSFDKQSLAADSKK